MSLRHLVLMPWRVKSFDSKPIRLVACVSGQPSAMWLKLDQKLGSATCKVLGNRNGMLKTSKGGFRGLQNPGHSRPTLIQVHTERCVHFWAKKV